MNTTRYNERAADDWMLDLHLRTAADKERLAATCERNGLMLVAARQANDELRKELAKSDRLGTVLVYLSIIAAALAFGMVAALIWGRP